MSLQISALLLPSFNADKSNSESFEGEGQQCLVCLVRRIPPNERIQGTPVEQFTTKLDIQGTIIAIDASGVSPKYSQYISRVSVWLWDPLFLIYICLYEKDWNI